MHKKSKRRSVAYIVSLLLTVFISIFIVLTISNFTIFNANYLLSKMESVNFYQEAISNLNKQIQQETQSTGFPIEMFENYIDEKEAVEIVLNDSEETLIYHKSPEEECFTKEALKHETINFDKESKMEEDLDELEK